MRSVLFGLLALSVSAHPSRPTLFKRAIDISAFRPKVESTYTNATVVESIPTVERAVKRADASDTATELVKKTVPGATFRLAKEYVGNNGIAHFYFKQTANGIDIDNADFNVNIGRNGEIFSFGNSFFEGDVPPASSLSKRDTVDALTALKGAVNVLQLPVNAESAKPEETDKNTFSIKGAEGAVSDPEARLVYFQTGGALALTWRVETDILSNWLLTYVDAKSGDQVHSVIDYSADATYEVYPWGINDPTEGSRVVVTDPWNDEASEFGFHSTGSESFKTTRGNNGIAHNNPSGELLYVNDKYLTAYRPESPDLKFEYPYSLNESDWLKYANASITQLFYTANVYHDLLHKLGFDEKAGNFEINNNGAGGLGNDFVLLNAQDGSGVNNANFATPVEGQIARMRMYIWDKTTPNRDCSFEAGVVIHEYTHGLSNRLTGGPQNSGCLSILEAGGMGEGWSDFYATAIRLKPGDTRKTNYAMGAWVNGNAAGIRTYLYSTDLTVNPHKYSDVDSLTRVHAIGTVWATTLYEVLWNLIDKHGKNDADLPEFDANGVPTDGKYLAMKLVLDGLALQPCNPTFVTARDAIIDADKALTGGDNACELWKGFAKRGLGDGAKYDLNKRTESFDLPEGVC
ncbi:extracellular metallo proteinase 2 [Aaosphaeria arxii CBS 175.79]|uniref:Extracellular metalloproteinase n=1 Tax=Aaosphaeria arxii CBS 175.79 TaxID=1450172 RepID=A0A6A5XNL2_9PLEO|nr:extracellular metallo proteinase 2 [Aaosphaeria arxii CBS 175.79]KAF2013944.1 extracellular metallo proteinase 2 [Aaosphaeria arxii CBS 175.79]